MPTVLVTGANRGLGLEFVRQYKDDGWEAIATCRNPNAADDLKATGAEVHRLDVGDFREIAALAGRLADRAIDVLLNNAGVYGHQQSFGCTDPDEWATIFRINTMAPMKMAEAFAGHLGRGQRRIIASVTSKMGSIEDNTSGGAYLYRSSKAALNAVHKSLSVDLKDRGIVCILLHPGWVKTDMGGPSALITAPQSVAGMRRIIENATPSHSGRFFAYDGQEVAW